MFDSDDSFSNPAAPIKAPSAYGSLDGIPEDIAKFFKANHDKLTISQLRRCADYFNNLASNVSRYSEENITIEDFEKAKKEDVDGDNEEGES